MVRKVRFEANRDFRDFREFPGSLEISVSSGLRNFRETIPLSFLEIPKIPRKVRFEANRDFRDFRDFPGILKISESAGLKEGSAWDFFQKSRNLAAGPQKRANTPPSYSHVPITGSRPPWAPPHPPAPRTFRGTPLTRNASPRAFSAYMPQVTGQGRVRVRVMAIFFSSLGCKTE